MATYKEIESANKTLKTVNIKGKDYIDVGQRIKAFRMVYPEGSIQTEIISEEGGTVIMRAVVSSPEGVILGTGTAFEKESSSYINKTSYIENCETSAVGRALGMCGFGIDSSIASAEEVANAINNQTDKSSTGPTKKATKKTESKEELICEVCGKPIPDYGKYTAMRIAKNSREQFGRMMCFECAKAFKAKKEEERSAETDGLPFPIED